MNTEELSIYTTYDSFEADKVIALFKSEGIPSYKREHGAGQYLSIILGTNTTQAIEIVIPESSEEKARQLLETSGII
ncbi:DUF2007 domain-containing protein [Butyrivibrio sp.]|uniref:putative signal transducing protein n=1 Tax=Butyrivibrio sp. TaxID=28121 RepID=UPI0025B927AF|nr:DUF2007 domain-containing protein [Butyrivibrio sp.]MBQ9305652.1 DUF2007 domain-containing protein [Butyrivibrio sp.]